LWPKPKMLFRCNCGRKICGTKVMIPGEGVCVPYPFARTSGRRAVSAVSLFYYEADKQNHLARSRGRGVPKTHCYTLDFGSYGYWDMGLGLGSISCAREERICTATPRVLRTLSRSSILSLEMTPPLGNTHTVYTVYI